MQKPVNLDTVWHKPNLSGVDMSHLSERQRMQLRRLEHQKLTGIHKGHEAMHSEMALILIVTLILAQIVLMQWKLRHFKSYERTTLLGMWLIPLGLCIYFGWWRFVFIWTLFSIVTTIVTIKASRKPLNPSTPRWVYKWFLLLFKTSYGIGIAGYIIVMVVIFAISPKMKPVMDFGLLILFYGLYFGVVSRDFAEVCADVMATQIGYTSSSGLPSKKLNPGMCAVCANEILVMNNENAVMEKRIKLNCGHIFHEFCIRGWCIVGKKQTCPYCKEKVDLKSMFPGPWERPQVMFGNLLDWIRYLVAWQPVVIGLVQAIYWSLGLE